MALAFAVAVPLAVALALAVARALVLTVALASAVHFPHSTDGFDKCGVVHEQLMLHLGWPCSECALFLMMATRRARAPCVPVIGPCTASCVIWFGFVCIHMGFCECFACFCTFLCIFNVFNRFYKVLRIFCVFLCTRGALGLLYAALGALVSRSWHP